MAEEYTVAVPGPCVACGQSSSTVGVNAGVHLHPICEGWYDAIIGNDLMEIEIERLTAQLAGATALLRLAWPILRAAAPRTDVTPQAIEAAVEHLRNLGIELDPERIEQRKQEPF